MPAEARMVYGWIITVEIEYSDGNDNWKMTHKDVHETEEEARYTAEDMLAVEFKNNWENWGAEFDSIDKEKLQLLVDLPYQDRSVIVTFKLHPLYC